MTFGAALSETPSQMRVELHSGFGIADWRELEDFCRREVREGITHWELDTRQVVWINELFVNLCLRLGLLLCSYQGKLRLILDKHSKAANLINFSQISPVVTIATI